jgi:large subunit ribosomal protein L25
MKIHDLPVERRDKLGSANSRRYRRAGKIPCILYGHGQENVPLTADMDSFDEVRKAHTALVRLKLGDQEQTALVRDVVWDVYGTHVAHIDLFRVEMKDEVKLKVPCTFVGTPAGASHGGDTQVVHGDIEVFARADSIPADFTIDISALEIGDGIHVGDVSFPENVRPASPAEQLIVHVIPPKKLEEPGEGEEEAELGEAAAEGEAPAEGGEAEEKPEE